MRLAFLGTPDFAATALSALIAAGHEIAAVYSQPARPAGRGQKLQPSPVETLALQHGLAVRTPTRLRNDEQIEAFRALQLDAAVVAAYGLILPKGVLEAPRLGCFNIHASLLPRWRGAAPIHRAILAGDSETGVTIMAMDEGLDTGAMLRWQAVPITPATTGGALHDALADLGARLMVDVLAQAEHDPLPPIAQPADGITYAAKLTKDEAFLDWRRPAIELDRIIRTFAPRPGAAADLLGERVKILEAELVAQDGPAGTALDDRLLIACGAGALRLTRLQRPGKGPVAADAFLNGRPVVAGQPIL